MKKFMIAFGLMFLATFPARACQPVFGLAAPCHTIAAVQAVQAFAVAPAPVLVAAPVVTQSFGFASVVSPFAVAVPVVRTRVLFDGVRVFAAGRGVRGVHRVRGLRGARGLRGLAGRKAIIGPRRGLRRR